jgi:arsenate reductase
MAAKARGKDSRLEVTIYHNPKCSTSRNVLAALREQGIEPHIVEYLKEPPSRAQLVKRMKQAGLSAAELIRAKEKTFAELGLDLAAMPEGALIDAMAEHPILMNRPIVVTPKGVRLCRPAERLDEIL